MGISIRAPNFLTTRGAIPENKAAECGLIYQAAMNAEFVQEIIDEEMKPLTGWEWIVFELEDEPDVEPALQPVRAG